MLFGLFLELLGYLLNTDRGCFFLKLPCAPVASIHSMNFLKRVSYLSMVRYKESKQEAEHLAQS